MRVILVSGGMIEETFALTVLQTTSYDKLIGIDRGVAFLRKHAVMPDLIVGDFDSLDEAVLEYFEGKVPIRSFLPEKDYTDTEIGVRAAIELGASEIVILGATGSRVDHVLGNIQTLMVALEHNVDAYILDAHNRIRLVSKEKKLKKEHMFGDYVSLLPLTTTVTGLSLRGFKYPLEQAVMTSSNSLGISNELVEEEAEISMEKGVLIMIESVD